MVWDDDVGRTSQGGLLELAIWECRVKRSVAGEGQKVAKP